MCSFVWRNEVTLWFHRTWSEHLLQLARQRLLRRLVNRPLAHSLDRAIEIVTHYLGIVFERGRVHHFRLSLASVVSFNLLRGPPFVEFFYRKSDVLVVYRCAFYTLVKKHTFKCPGWLPRVRLCWVLDLQMLRWLALQGTFVNNGDVFGGAVLSQIYLFADWASRLLWILVLRSCSSSSRWLIDERILLDDHHLVSICEKIRSRMTQQLLLWGLRAWHLLNI